MAGAPRGNKNALKEKKKRTVGGQKGNLNALKHGLYTDGSKRLPDEVARKIFPTTLKNMHQYCKEMNLEPLEYLRNSIDTMWATIMTSIKITEVKNKRDMTKELKRTKESDSSVEKEYEIQFAWDKENARLDVFTKSMERLARLIDIYEKYTGEKYLLEIEEKKINIERLKRELEILNGGNSDNKNATKKLDSILEQMTGSDNE